MKRIQPLLIVIFFIASVYMGVIAERYSHYVNTPKNAITDTIISVSVDTLRDTIIEKNLLPAEIIKKNDTIFAEIHDTIYCLISEQKIYRDSNFVAYVSGYEPRLDSIKFFNTSIVKTITNTAMLKDDKPHVYVGFGMQYTTNTFIPQVNVGITKGNWQIGTNIGLFHKLPIYGINANYIIK